MNIHPTELQQALIQQQLMKRDNPKPEEWPANLDFELFELHPDTLAQIRRSQEYAAKTRNVSVGVY